MSWRDVLGATDSTDINLTHNAHNSQKQPDSGNCADIADSALRNSAEIDSKLLEAMTIACQGLSITPGEVRQALSSEDINDWRNGDFSNELLTAFVQSLAQRKAMEKGNRPDHYTEQATCQYCGPIWLWFSAEVLSCPWCWNRINGRPIPRPVMVRCGDCANFRYTSHFSLGHCSKGEPENIAGLRDTDRRHCESFLPKPTVTPPLNSHHKEQSC